MYYFVNVKRNNKFFMHSHLLLVSLVCVCVWVCPLSPYVPKKFPNIRSFVTVFVYHTINNIQWWTLCAVKPCMQKLCLWIWDGFFLLFSATRQKNGIASCLAIFITAHEEEDVFMCRFYYVLQNMVRDEQVQTADGCGNGFNVSGKGKSESVCVSCVNNLQV